MFLCFPSDIVVYSSQIYVIPKLSDGIRAGQHQASKWGSQVQDLNNGMQRLLVSIS